MHLKKIRKNKVYWTLSFNSSKEQVKRHFGNPLQPTNSPYLPDLLISSLPQLGHTPTTFISRGLVFSLPQLGQDMHADVAYQRK